VEGLDDQAQWPDRIRRRDLLMCFKV